MANLVNTEKLLLARQWAGLSRKQAVERLPFAGRTLANYESGQTDPGFFELREMSTLYGVQINWLLDTNDIESTKNKLGEIPGFDKIPEEQVDRLVEVAASVGL